MTRNPLGEGAIMKFRNFRADVVAAAAAALWLAACTGSSPASAPPGGEGGAGGSPGDGTSVYLNVLPPGSNGNSAGGVGAPVPGVPVLKYPPISKTSSRSTAI